MQSTDIDESDDFPQVVSAGGMLFIATIVWGLLVSANLLHTFDKAITPEHPMQNVVRYEALWDLITPIVMYLYSSAATMAVAILGCIVSITHPKFKRPANTLAVVSVALLVFSMVTRAVYARMAPQMFLGSYPNMQVASALGFYGSALMLCRFCAPLAMQCILAAVCVGGIAVSAWWALFFGYAWASDVIGGLLLGACAVATTFKIVQKQ